MEKSDANITSRKQRVVGRRKRIFKRTLIAVGAVLGLIIVSVLLLLFFRFGPVAKETIFNKNIELKNQEDEPVNILLLGIGGGNHEGPNLTDTIIFTNIDPKQKRITLVSIPRDFWVTNEQTKINSIYAFSESKEKGLGLVDTKEVVSDILGQDIDYVVRIDFDGFVNAVDLMGGLEIDVERTLDDYAYPINGKEEDACGHDEEKLEELATASAETLYEELSCRYEHLHFDEGVQYMDGETALKFVRSRHAIGAEGSDFARSKRQEKVISSFKDKIFSLGTILNPVKVLSLYDVLKDSIATDIKESEYDDFIKLAQKMENASVESVILDLGDPQTERLGLLTNPIPSDEYRGQWVIVPRKGNGDYTEIQAYISCKLSGDECEITPTGTARISPTPTE